MAAGRALHVTRQRFQLRKKARRLGPERSAGSRQRHRPLRAVEQSRSELALDALDVPRERRRRDVEARGRAAEMQLFGDDEKDAKVGWIHDYLQG